MTAAAWIAWGSLAGVAAPPENQNSESSLSSNAAPAPEAEAPAFEQARKSAEIAGITLSKVQRWLHEVALPKIDPKTGLYISHNRGSARYREALWNYDDAAADTYPFLFWAAWYTDHEIINGPILEVLEAEQRHCNYLDRIPTAVNHRTLEKVIKSKENLIFAASEYLKDGLIPIVEVSGKNTPWFQRMQDIEDDIWKHADVDTPYGKIPSHNLEANGEQLQILARLFTMTRDEKYLEWAERIADHYLLDGKFRVQSLRDHGCEIVGGLGLLLAVESIHRPEKAQEYLPHIRAVLDRILEEGLNEDGLMYNRPGNPAGGLSDSWGYNYVSFLCHDMALEEPKYQDRVERTLRNLGKPKYRDYPWQRNSMDGYADSIEGAMYLLNRIPVEEGFLWADREVMKHIVIAHDPDRLWTTYKLESNGVRTALIHALRHTRGLIARPWQQGLQVGAEETAAGLSIYMKSEQAYSGKLVFDIPRHREFMGFARDWPRMNTIPEWFTVDLDGKYVVKDRTHGWTKTFTGRQLHEGLPINLEAGKEQFLLVVQ